MYKFNIYTLKYCSSYLNEFGTISNTASKELIDYEAQMFLEGMDSFWLDCQGIATECFEYNGKNIFTINLSKLSLRQLIMYYADVVSHMEYSQTENPSLKTWVLTILVASIYNWLEVVSNEDRKKILSILKNEPELFGYFSLDRGYQALYAIEANRSVRSWLYQAIYHRGE
jgi:hypothetical protein